MKLPFARDIYLKLVALLLAVVIWFVAGADIRKSRGDMVEKFITAGVEIRGAASEFVVAAKPRDVEVRVRGPKHLVEPLDGSKVTAHASVAGRGEGEHAARVQVSAPDGVQVVEAVPASVGVTVEAVIARDLPVTVALMGYPREAHVPLEPEATPRSVMVIGPRSQVGMVKSALARVDVSGVTSSVSRNIEVVPVDAGSDPVAGVTSHPALVRVLVPVEERLGRFPAEEAAVEGEEKGASTSDEAAAGAATSPR